MDLRRESTGSPVRMLTCSLIGSGGEARIFGLSDPAGFAAKIYHRPTAERTAKLRAMLRNPPVDPLTEQGRLSIAWPCELLVDGDNERRVAGFLMRRAVGMRPLIDLYHPKTRRQRNPLFNYPYLLRTARNLAACVSALHERGYVIGDLNESNILVGQTALVALVDTDSFQVCDPETNVVHRCRVGKPEFTPPELQSVRFAWVDRKPEHDLFGLAVLVFQLLMEGIHPFAGRHTGSGEPPSLEERIALGQFPYAASPESGVTPMPTSPPFELLSPTLRRLFLRCFVDAHAAPALRPSAKTWQEALLDSEHTLATCKTNEQHRYGTHLADCPWCARKRLLRGIDPFPSREAVCHHTHLFQAVLPLRSRKPASCHPTDAIRLARADAARRRRARVVWPLAVVAIGATLVWYWWWVIATSGLRL